MSGAKLFLCYLGSGLPFVVKVDSATNIDREFGAMSSVSYAFREADAPLRTPPRRPDGSVERAAICYHHRGGMNEHEIQRSKELRELILSLALPDDFVNEKLQSVFDQVLSAQSGAKPRPVQPYEHYEWYLRNGASDGVLRSILGDRANQEEFEFLGAKVFNPLLLLERFKSMTSIKLLCGPSHGDLHANNVIVDFHNQVHLIDFAWASTSRHFCADYVLMECSLRFLLFPSHVNLRSQLLVDQSLLDRDGYLSIPNIVADCELRPYYERLASFLGTIRMTCQKIMTRRKVPFDSYLLSQFFVLYGLLKYESYNQYAATRALGLLANRLQGIDFTTL